jgi:hypothetical protein
MLFGASGETVGPDATVGVWVRELTSIGMRKAAGGVEGECDGDDAVLDATSERAREDVGIG